jgi:tetratricopeptide (TPR) repeat protein
MQVPSGTGLGFGGTIEPPMAAQRVRLGLGVCCVLLATSTVGAGQGDVARAKEAYSRAVELEARGNHAGALSLLWEAAGLVPRDADVQNSLGEALERMGALDAAVDAYRRAVAERPDFRKASNNLILALVKAGKGPEAVQRAEALVSAAPADPDRLFTLGLAQAEQDIDQSIASFRRVLELAPRHTLARYNLALVLRRADRLAEAIDELGRALAIEPRAEAHYTLGVIRWHQGDVDGAVRALRAAVEAEPRYVDAHYTLGAILKARRDWAGAQKALRTAIALRPDLPAAHYALGQVLQLAGDESGGRDQLAESEALRQRAAREHEALTWTSVGIAKAETGDLAGALEHFRRATAAFEAYAPAHYQMGLALQRLGQGEASRAAFARAQQLNPSLVPPR